MKEVEEKRGRESLDVCPLLLGCSYSCRSFYLGHEKHWERELTTPTCPIQKQTKAQGHPCALLMLTCIPSPFRCHLLVVLATPDHISIKIISYPPEVPEREYSSANRHRQKKKKKIEFVSSRISKRSNWSQHGAEWKHKKDMFKWPFSTPCLCLVLPCESNFL